LRLRPTTTPPVLSPLALHAALPICLDAQLAAPGRDLDGVAALAAGGAGQAGHRHPVLQLVAAATAAGGPGRGQGHAGERRIAAQDRKSTRLNSSHVKISYAVFCLKK